MKQLLLIQEFLKLSIAFLESRLSKIEARGKNDKGL